jgi:hypothetical protein
MALDRSDAVLLDGVRALMAGAKLDGVAALANGAA